MRVFGPTPTRFVGRGQLLVLICATWDVFLDSTGAAADTDTRRSRAKSTCTSRIGASLSVLLQVCRRRRCGDVFYLRELSS